MKLFSTKLEFLYFFYIRNIHCTNYYNIWFERIIMKRRFAFNSVNRTVHNSSKIFNLFRIWSSDLGYWLKKSFDQGSSSDFCILGVHWVFRVFQDRSWKSVHIGGYHSSCFENKFCFYFPICFPILITCAVSIPFLESFTSKVTPNIF